jgi:hypothetical protein
MKEEDVERLLDTCSPVPPPESLDGKMATLFDEAERRRIRQTKRRVPLWLCLAACAACAALGFVAHRLTVGEAHLLPTPVHTVVYIMEPNAALTRALLGASPGESTRDMRLKFYVQKETESGAAKPPNGI